MKSNLKTLAFFLASAILTSIIPFTANAAAHGVGTNISGSDGTVYMITLGGQRRPYTSAGAFLSYGFNSWASVVPANSDDLALPVGQFIPPQSGKVFCSDKGSDIGTCYIIGSAAKIGIPSEKIFNGLGYSFSRALYGDVSFLPQTSVLQTSTDAHSAGTLVNNNGTVYIVGDSGLLGFSSPSVFAGWGFDFADVVTANTADKALAVTGVAAARQYGQLAPLPVTPGVFAISDLSPSSGVIGDTITVHGNGWFVSSGNTVRFGNGFANSTFVDANTLTFTVPATLSSGSCAPPMACPSFVQPVTPGTYNVDVENSNGRANILAFTVIGNTLVVSNSSMSPLSGPTGSQVTITGTGFTSANNTIHFDGNGHTATMNGINSSNGTTLQFTVPSANDTCPYCAATAVTPGSYNVKITNANGTSNPLGFTVNTASTPGISISSLSPTSGPTSTVVTIKGTGFASGNNLVNFGSISVSFWSYPGTYPAILSADGTSLSFTIPSMDNPGCSEACPHRAPLPTSPGVYQISVTNGSGTSNILNFTVTQ